MPEKTVPRGGGRGKGAKAKQAAPKPPRKPNVRRSNQPLPHPKPGRPSSYTPKIGQVICDGLMEGKSLRAVCRSEGMPSMSMVMRWLPQQPAFREQYAQAREAQVDVLAEEILDIADDESQDQITGEAGPQANPVAVQRAKLRVDARKWFASKLAPKKYGDRQEIEHTGGIEHTHLTLDELKTRLDEARADGPRPSEGQTTPRSRPT